MGNIWFNKPKICVHCCKKGLDVQYNVFVIQSYNNTTGNRMCVYFLFLSATCVYFTYRAITYNSMLNK